MERFIGVDPGERWCGLAVLCWRDNQYHAMCSVLDVKTRSFTQLIDTLTTPAGDLVVTERFQTRGSGHQHMHNPVTAQIIGAIRYAAQSKGGQWAEVNPASPQDLQYFPVYPIIVRWRKYWPEKNNSRWNHALSAWRVLCQYLLTIQHTSIVQLANSRVTHFETIELVREPTELLSPTARWTL